MDIYNYLKKDHRKVSRLFKKIIQAKANKEKQRLLLNLMQELELHADSEHETFYQALSKDFQGSEDTEHANEEHREIKKALGKLSKISPTETAKWFVQLGELKSIVEHHVEYEESKMFEDAKNIISKDEAEDLVSRMEELKENMMQSKSFKKKFKMAKNKKRS